MSTLWVYPGQGVQKPNMLHDLPQNDVTRHYLDRASQALGQDVLTRIRQRPPIELEPCNCVY